MADPLRAHALDAGIHPLNQSGWIELLWEEWRHWNDKDMGRVSRVRRITVSYARAKQAMNALANGRNIA